MSIIQMRKNEAQKLQNCSKVRHRPNVSLSPEAWLVMAANTLCRTLALLPTQTSYELQSVLPPYVCLSISLPTGLDQYLTFNRLLTHFSASSFSVSFPSGPFPKDTVLMISLCVLIISKNVPFASELIYLLSLIGSVPRLLPLYVFLGLSPKRRVFTFFFFFNIRFFHEFSILMLYFLLGAGPVSAMRNILYFQTGQNTLCFSTAIYTVPLLI